MIAVEFVKSKLELIAEKYFDIKFRYEYEEDFGNHLIETVPSEYNNNIEIQDHLMELSEKFSLNFPYDCIVFVDHDDIVGITNETYVVKGKLHDFLLDISFWAKNVSMKPLYGEALMDEPCFEMQLADAA